MKNIIKIHNKLIRFSFSHHKDNTFDFHSKHFQIIIYFTVMDVDGSMYQRQLMDKYEIDFVLYLLNLQPVYNIEG